MVACLPINLSLWLSTSLPVYHPSLCLPTRYVALPANLPFPLPFCLPIRARSPYDACRPADLAFLSICLKAYRPTDQSTLAEPSLADQSRPVAAIYSLSAYLPTEPTQPTCLSTSLRRRKRRRIERRRRRRMDRMERIG